MKEEVAANAMGGSSPSNPASAIAQPERLLAKTPIKRLRDIIGPKSIRSELNKDKSHGI